MNPRSTSPGQGLDPNKKSFYYSQNKDITLPRQYADDVEHGFFQGGKMAYLWDTYVRDEEYSYIKEAAADLRGEITSRSLPICFDKCVLSFKDLKLSTNQRTCFIRCYLRRQSSLSDAMVYFDSQRFQDNINGPAAQNEIN